ncbi:MAG TPA: M20/M25/M40 family metallo-hydrolase, partial [Pyrinomonadaceae bacterium]|nr:M20/M25/M40 family metallo-hydrolase [Pyrinomonadaceae bacterium]
VVRASASPEQFSAERAMTYLNVIGQRPHPSGTSEHKAVRDYLLNELSRMGVTPAVQKTVVLRPTPRTPFHVGTVENVLVRLEGASNSKAVLLIAHYDSVPTSPGVSDNGAAVAAMLETVRALRASERLKNDVIFLFTDAEEVGLMGARAFIKEHPWAKDVGIVLNFEARGSEGPALMFETSDGNGWLIKELARAGAPARTNSLLYEAYRRLPNETDMTMFKQAGYPGLNFAYIDGAARYHSQSDSLDQLDQRSVQHQGLYALALARHYGNVDLTNTKASNAVYFDLLGLTLIHYPTSWVIPLTILTLLVFVVVAFLGLKKGRLTLAGIAFGFAAVIATLVGVVAVVALLQFNIWALYRNYRLMIQGSTYNSGFYVVSFVALAIAIAASLYIWFHRKTNAENLHVGALLAWALMMILSSLYAPGASYLFTLPLLFALAPLAWRVAGEKRDRLTAGQVAALYAFAVPGIVLLVPILDILFIGLPPSDFKIVIVLVVLLLALLLPHLDLIAAPNRWLLPGIAVLVSLTFVVLGSWTSGFNRERPQPTNLFYALNADSGKAVWASTDEQLDTWTAEFFTEGVKKGAISDYIASNYNRFSSSPAPVASLPAPEVSLVSDNTNNGVRSVRLRITSRREAPFISVTLQSATEVIGASVNGKQIDNSQMSAQTDPNRLWRLLYYAPPAEGIDLDLQVRASEPLKLRVQDQSFELPASLTASFKPRPADKIPTAYPFNPLGDATIVSKSFAF